MRVHDPHDFTGAAQKSFKELIVKLKQYVVNYRNKVLEPAGRVKHENYTIQKGVWKFNQYYDLIVRVSRTRGTIGGKQ